MTTAFDKSVMFAGKRPEPVTALDGNDKFDRPRARLAACSNSPPEIGEIPRSLRRLRREVTQRRKDQEPIPCPWSWG